jgi:ADP-heptose:LPS heptosyltransferase
LGDRIIDLDLVYESRRALHPLDAYAQIAEVVPEHPDPVFHPLKRDREAMAKRMKSGLPENLQHIVALHTAASSPDRIWPKEHWKAFIHSMLEEGRTGIVLLGAGKDYDGKDLDLPPHPLVLDLVRTLDLSETGACLSFCDLVIGPDSGLSHLGPAVGTPVLALHNMAIPETRLPFRIPGKALWVDAPCRGCLSHIPPNHPVACIHKNVDCMRSILPEQVHHTAREMLGSIPAHAWQRRVHAGSRKADPASAPVPPRPPARFVDNPVFTPLRILCQMIRNHRNHAMWASRKDLKIG